MLHFLEWDQLIILRDGTFCSPSLGVLGQFEKTYNDVLTTSMGVLGFEGSHLRSSWCRRERPKDCSALGTAGRGVWALPASLGRPVTKDWWGAGPGGIARGVAGCSEGYLYTCAHSRQAGGPSVCLFASPSLATIPSMLA